MVTSAALTNDGARSVPRDYLEVARLKPGDVWVLYNLACAEALNGRTADAVAALRASGHLVRR